MAATREVRMLSNMAGAGRDDLWEYGKTYKVEAALAERLIERELAEPVVETKKRSAASPAPSSATAEKRETAAQPAAERR